MRFMLGVAVGVVIGRPIMSVASRHLTPPVRKKINDGLVNVANRIADYINAQEAQENN